MDEHGLSEGIRMCTDEDVPVGSDIALRVSGYEFKGQVRWIASIENGRVVKREGIEDRVSIGLACESLAEWLHDESARGYRYVIGIQVYGGS